MFSRSVLRVFNLAFGSLQSSLLEFFKHTVRMTTSEIFSKDVKTGYTHNLFFIFSIRGQGINDVIFNQPLEIRVLGLKFGFWYTKLHRICAPTWQQKSNGNKKC